MSDNNGKGKSMDELSWEDFDKVTLDVEHILHRVQEFHATNGQDSMRRIIESKQGDFDKWPVSLVHSITVKFLFDAVGQLQAEIEKLKKTAQPDSGETKSEQVYNVDMSGIFLPLFINRIPIWSLK